MITILIYYNKIKKENKLGEITYVNNSLLCMILKIVNRITKNQFNGITNPFTMKVHTTDKDFFNNPTYNNFYRHELIHLRQVAYYGKIKFLLKYIWYSIKYRYARNPFELQAYRYEHNFKDEQLLKEFEKGIERVYKNV